MDCSWIKIYDTATIGTGTMLDPHSLNEGATIYVDVTDIPNGYTLLEWKDTFGHTLDDTVIHLTSGGRWETSVYCGLGFIAVLEHQGAEVCLIQVSCDTTQGSVSLSGDNKCGGTVTITATPVNCCYRFTTWSDGSTSDNRTVSVPGPGVTQYTANFTQETFTITAGPNVNAYGSVQMTPSNGLVHCGDEYTLTAVANQGYQFVRWSNGNTSTTLTYTYQCGGAISYTAEFEPIPTYQLTYVDGVQTYDGGTYHDGDNFTAKGDLTQQHYTLLGWTLTQGSSAVDYIAGQQYSFNFGDDTTLYSVWREDEQYTIYYIGLDDNDYESNADYYANVQFNLVPASSLQKVGYQFLGWCIMDSKLNPGETPSCVTGVTGTYTMPAKVQYAYGLWSQDIYTVRYIGDTGESTDIISTQQTQVVKSIAELNFGPYTTKDFTFWAVENDVTNRKDPGQTITVANPGDVITLYAQFTPKPTYNLTYHLTDGVQVTGTGPQNRTGLYSFDSVVVDNGHSLSLPGDFYFDGWSTSPSRTTTDYAGGSVITNFSTDVDLYDKWVYIPKVYITYNSNKSGVANTITDGHAYSIGETATITSQTYSEYNHSRHIGWSTNANAITPDYVGGDTFTITQNITFYAVWQNAIVLTYNNGKSGATGSVPTQYSYTGQFTLAYPPYTYPCCSVNGWSQTNDSGTVQYTGGQSVTFNSNTTLYGVWDCCTITFHTTNASISTLWTYVDKGEEKPEPQETQWDETICFEEGLVYDVTTEKAEDNCCLVGWLEDCEFIQPCKEPDSYQYILIPPICIQDKGVDVYVDEHQASPLDNTSFLNEMLNSTYQYGSMIYNEDTDQILQRVNVCKDDAYEIACNSEITAVIECLRLVQTDECKGQRVIDVGEYNDFYELYEYVLSMSPLPTTTDCITAQLGDNKQVVYYEIINPCPEKQEEPEKVEE